ncbi:MAG: hypothetical protein HXK70_05475 [Clostridiales bacterium]|nr:hypothetical protein [Clostridiales bacterium]
MKTNKKGITLIALVITIIILLILAAVAIQLALGENGLIGRAQSGQEKQSTAEAAEKFKTAQVAAFADYVVSKKDDTAKQAYVTALTNALGEITDPKIKNVTTSGTFQASGTPGSLTLTGTVNIAFSGTAKKSLTLQTSGDVTIADL